MVWIQIRKLWRSNHLVLVEVGHLFEHGGDGGCGSYLEVMMQVPGIRVIKRKRAILLISHQIPGIKSIEVTCKSKVIITFSVIAMSITFS